MSIAVLRLITLLTIVGASVNCWPAEREQRIQLKSGRGEVRITGRLTAKNDQVHYILRANKGQRLTLTLMGPGPLSATVTSPSGKEEGQPGGGVFFDQELIETGDYRIHISEGNRGEKRDVRFVLGIRINSP
jgi:hypothetical protein